MKAWLSRLPMSLHSLAVLDIAAPARTALSDEG
jgi:hypothetical protein